MEENLVVNQVIGSRSVRGLGIKMSILKRLDFSEIKMVRGSPVSKKNSIKQWNNLKIIFMLI